jgi:hypothetical protein
MGEWVGHLWLKLPQLVPLRQRRADRSGARDYRFHDEAAVTSGLSAADAFIRSDVSRECFKGAAPEWTTIFDAFARAWNAGRSDELGRRAHGTCVFKRWRHVPTASC